MKKQKVLFIPSKKKSKLALSIEGEKLVINENNIKNKNIIMYLLSSPILSFFNIFSSTKLNIDTCKPERANKWLIPFNL